MKTTLLTTALCTIAASLPAQDQKKDRNPGPNYPVIEESSLTLLQHTPSRPQGASTLAEVAYSMWGRQFVTERGSRNVRRNIFQNVGSIIVYDEAERARRILSMIKELDNSRHSGATPLKLETKIIKISHASVQEVQQALRPFQRSIVIRGKDGGGYQVNNLEVLDSRSCVVIREERANLEAMQDLIAKIDTPRSQVMLTCWIIRASNHADEKAEENLKLPENLVGDLKKLVQMKHFAPLGMGLLNSSVEPRGTISLSVNLRDQGRADLKLLCRSFDTSSNVLHLTQCTSQLMLAAQSKRGRGSNQSFTTQVSLKAGEYTVLGAMGAEPVFVVLKVDRKSRTN